MYSKKILVYSKLCNVHIIIFENCYHSNRSPISFIRLINILSPSTVTKVKINLLYVFMDVPILGLSYKLNHKIYGIL